MDSFFLFYRKEIAKPTYIVEMRLYFGIFVYLKVVFSLCLYLKLHFHVKLEGQLLSCLDFTYRLFRNIFVAMWVGMECKEYRLLVKNGRKGKREGRGE